MNRRTFLVLGTTSAAAALSGCVSGESFQSAALGYRPVPQLGSPDREEFRLPPVEYSTIPVEFRRQFVSHSGKYSPGTIVVDTAGRHLFLIVDSTTAIRYGIGVGREGFSWGGRAKIGRKAKWPTWTPPSRMIQRQPELRRWAGGMPGGPANPLGARAMYLYSGGRDTLYRLHGTNDPSSIGKAMSSGCIRMLNRDAIDLYERVSVGTPVVVVQGGALV
ncbi:L,D-transpeptidase [Acuticoccus sediminis]|uniref:L,D-transpeptidase n=1 Tax=Acuticoccus sediminis TaxID=2184697 RepID=A0A8B2NTJ5_9HYPH|nr:L,D-transpeptidase [Acuticoccus sediminis]RAH99589.1 L,D-transpeptidase [Acuticoccus sediminis]